MANLITIIELGLQLVLALQLGLELVAAPPRGNIG